MSKVITIYTDGACRGNPGMGGWGAILISGDHRKEIKGAETETTNNRMEMTAAIRALQALKKQPSQVALYTDSVYLRSGILEWMPKWKRNGWKTSGRKPVKNLDLWQELDAITMNHAVEWHWIKGHAGHPGNERADELANEAIDEFNIKQSCYEKKVIV